MKKISIASWIVFVAALVWMRGQWELLNARKSLEARQGKLAAAQQIVEADRTALESARRDQEKETRAHSQMVKSVAGARRKLAEADPDGQWAAPPPSLPDWDSSSPYIWLRKDDLASVGAPGLNWSGKLSESGANLLGVDDESRVKLNQQVQSVLDEFHSQQNSNAVVTNTVPNGRTIDGPVVTVQIPASTEAGQALQGQITQILEQNLGSDRASLLTNSGANWLSGFSMQEPSVFAVLQHPNGTYYIYSKIGNDYHDSDGIPARDAYSEIPQNLLPFFTNVSPASAGGP